MRKVCLAAAAAVAFATPASAAVVYSNNFDTENGGNTALNYNGFNGLTVTAGTVDLVANTDYGIKCAGNSGACVDLDGSTFDAGITSSNTFAFNSGDVVSLSFLYSGNQRALPVDRFSFGFVFVGAANLSSRSGNAGSFVFNSGPIYNVGAFGVTVSDVAPDAEFTSANLSFVAASAGSFNFRIRDFGSDNVGVVIDNVSLSIGAVPEPSTWAMLILGFGVIGAAARRRKAAGAAAVA